MLKLRMSKCYWLFPFLSAGIFQIAPINLKMLSYRSSASNFENLSISGLSVYPGTQQIVVNQLTDQTCEAIEEELLYQLSDSITDYLNAQLKVSSESLCYMVCYYGSS